jgi:hypothetical protein
MNQAALMAIVDGFNYWLLPKSTAHSAQATKTGTIQQLV